MSGIMVIRSKNPVNSVLFLILVFCNATGLLILVDLDFFAMIFLVVYVGAIAVLFLFVVMMLNVKITEINENILRYLPIGGIIGIIFLFEIFLMVDNDITPLIEFGGFSDWNPHSQYDYVFYYGNAMAAQGFVYDRFRYFVLGMYKYYFVTMKLKRFSKRYEKFCEIDMSSLPIAPLKNPWFTEWALATKSVTNIESIGAIVYTYYFYYFLVASMILLVAMIGAIVLTMHKNVDVKKQEVFDQNTRQFKKTVRPTHLGLS